MPYLHTCTDAELAAEIERRRDAAVASLRMLSAADAPARSVNGKRDEIDRLIHAAASLFGITKAGILSRSRAPSLVHARQAIWLTLRRRHYTFTAMEVSFQRTHAAIIHGCESAVKRAEADASYKAKLEALSTQL